MHILTFKRVTDGRGDLYAAEGGRDVPFDIKRVYYITNAPEGVRRGFHAHRTLRQVMICLRGSVKLRLFDGRAHEELTLDSPDTGVYVGPGIWREMVEFEKHSVLLVLASEHYDEADYIRDLEEFKEFVKQN